MAYSEDIIKQARDLYFELDQAGNRRYTNVEIARSVAKKNQDKIKKGNKKSNIDQSTIKLWETKYNWKDQLNEIKKRAAQKALIKQKKEDDKMISEMMQRSNVLHSLYKSTQEKFDLSTRIAIAKLQMTLASIVGGKILQQAMMNFGKNEEEIHRERLDDRSFASLFKTISGQQISLANILADITPQEEIRASLSDDSELIKAIVEMKEKIKESNPDIAHIIEGVEIIDIPVEYIHGKENK